MLGQKAMLIDKEIMCDSNLTFNLKKDPSLKISMGLIVYLSHNPQRDVTPTSIRGRIKAKGNMNIKK